MINKLIVTLIGVFTMGMANAFVEDLEFEIHAPMFVKQQKTTELRGGGILVNEPNYDFTVETSSGTIIWR